ncbi:MAG: TRAP transporter small permease subunit [Betaproteobacteria bacterium]|nr:MAG: TRAP transporter small permease subunit [Betaproteobacteria bacterium]
MRDRASLRPLRLLTDSVAVALMATMFVSFLLQIFFRYVLNRPLGWTEEVTVLCWLWVVLWSAALLLSDAEEVRFDIIYSAVPRGARRAFVIVSSVALVVLLAISIPATWRYIAFMKREHSAYLHMRFDILYSIYLVFVVAVIVKHVRLTVLAIRGDREVDDEMASQAEALEAQDDALKSRGSS